MAGCTFQEDDYIQPDEKDFPEMIEEQEEPVKFSKTIDGEQIELEIPNDWHYEELEEEENNTWIFSLKLYKDSSEDSVSLHYYRTFLGVCGTGLKAKDMTCNDGAVASIGYYDNSDIWTFISYSSSRKVAFWNEGLNAGDAEEFLEIAKTLQITESNETEEICSYPTND